MEKVKEIWEILPGRFQGAVLMFLIVLLIEAYAQLRNIVVGLNVWLDFSSGIGLIILGLYIGLKTYKWIGEK